MKCVTFCNIMGKKRLYFPSVSHSHLIDVNLGLCRGLQESTAAPLTGEILALFLPDHPLVFQITLITHQDHWNLKRNTSTEFSDLNESFKHQ